jgi:hypothetical protein
MSVGLVVVHLDQTREIIRAAIVAVPEDEPNYLHRLRLYNAKSGLPSSVLTQIRQELTSEFGEPIHRTPKVEIYRVSSSTGLP